MARFYHFSLEYIYSLQTCEFHKLAKSMEILEAKEMLKDMKVAAFPHMKKESHDELKKAVARVANRLEEEAKPRLSGREIAKALGLT